MRKMVPMLLLVFVLGALSFAGQAQQNANVAGNWTFSMELPNGPRTSDMTITQDGEKIEVTMKSQRGDTKGAGTVKGNAIEWSVTRTAPQGGGEFTTTYKGTVDGDKMSGEVVMGQRGTMKWTATRNK